MSKRFYFKGNPMQLLLLIVKKKQQQRRFLKIERAKFLWFRKWFFLPPSLSLWIFHAWLFRSHGFNLSKLQKLVFCVISRPISFWRKKAKIIEIVHNFFLYLKICGSPIAYLIRKSGELLRRVHHLNWMMKTKTQKILFCW